MAACAKIRTVLQSTIKSKIGHKVYTWLLIQGLTIFRLIKYPPSSGLSENGDCDLSRRWEEERRREKNPSGKGLYLDLQHSLIFHKENTK